MKKSQHAGLAQQNGWSSIIAQFAEAGKSHSKAPARQDVI
jgi:hypothetical protein